MLSRDKTGVDVDEGRYLQQLVRGYESAASVCLIMPDVSEIVYSSHGIRTRDKEKLENDNIVLRDEDGLQTLFGKTEPEKDSLIRANICDKSKRKWWCENRLPFAGLKGLAKDAGLGFGIL